MNQTPMELAKRLGDVMVTPRPGRNPYTGHLREVKRLIGIKKHKGAQERLRQFKEHYPHTWNCQIRTAYDQLMKALG